MVLPVMTHYRWFRDMNDVLSYTSVANFDSFTKSSVTGSIFQVIIFDLRRNAISSVCCLRS